ncbi:MAG: LysR family transcriptional regulator [Sandaracinus sp.]|nr:LysR family transcriptional regulator [Myxococcales bacterium]MCB9613819.1 LysR family transcriptional regulator [Sandaracinus sp.]
MSAIPFAQLQTFLAVARAKSFSGAARELGVSRSAVSQSVRQLEEQLHVVLLQRTTRSVALTEAGRRIVEGVAPAFAQASATLAEVTAQPGEAVGRLRLTVPRSAAPMVFDSVLPTFRERHPRVEVELVFEERFVDIVAGGFDGGIRLSEAIERDMARSRLTAPFRFVVVGAPSYLDQRGVPQKPDDLLAHECITFRSPTNNAPYAWELERGRKSWRVPVRGGVVTNDGLICGDLALRGLGLAYAPEPLFADAIRRGELRVVLDAYAATVPGYFLYYPSRAQRSTPLRLFLEVAKERLSKKSARAAMTS